MFCKELSKKMFENCEDHQNLKSMCQMFVKTIVNDQFESGAIFKVDIVSSQSQTAYIVYCSSLGTILALQSCCYISSLLEAFTDIYLITYFSVAMMFIYLCTLLMFCKELSKENYLRIVKITKISKVRVKCLSKLL